MGRRPTIAALDAKNAILSAKLHKLGGQLSSVLKDRDGYKKLVEEGPEFNSEAHRIIVEKDETNLALQQRVVDLELANKKILEVCEIMISLMKGIK